MSSASHCVSYYDFPAVGCFLKFCIRVSLLPNVFPTFAVWESCINNVFVTGKEMQRLFSE